MQTLGLAQDRARMLQQRAAGRRWYHTLPSAREQRDAECVLHVANPGRGGGERQVPAFGAAGDAAGLDDVAEQAEIGKIEAHEGGGPFVFREIILHKNPIEIAYLNANVSHSTKCRSRDKPPRVSADRLRQSRRLDRNACYVALPASSEYG